MHAAAGRLKSIPSHITSLAYNARGQVTVATCANGVTTTNSYNDQRGWLSNFVTAKGATTLQNVTIARDAAGRIGAITRAGQAADSWTYAYDTLDRLLSATNKGDAGKSSTYKASRTPSYLRRRPGSDFAPASSPVGSPLECPSLSLLTAHAESARTACLRCQPVVAASSSRMRPFSCRPADR